MDPRSWADLLYTYGPYAILVLFVLWVVPRQTKEFNRQLSAGNRGQQLVSGFFALASFVVVLVAVAYIFVKWPPVTVYSGTLGIHPTKPEPAQFYSQSSQLYLVSSPTPDGRLRWDYVVVMRQPANVEKFDFTYQWGAERQQYTDLTLPLRLLKRRRVDLSAASGDPGTLLYDHDSDPNTPPEPYTQIAYAKPSATQLAGSVTLAAAAHAQSRPTVDKSIVIDWLGSSDANLRAQGRAQLRQLSQQELKQLLQSPGLSDIARTQIESELRRSR